MATKNSFKFQFIPLFISILTTQAVGIASAYFTLPEVEGWYRTIAKPPITPPDWAFAPVWTAIYLLTGISAYIVWERRDGSLAYKTVSIVYALQLLINFLWAFIFFGMHQIFGGMIDTVLLWLAVLLNMICFYKFNRVAGWLLLPYLLWVSFSVVLSVWLLQLNQ